MTEYYDFSGERRTEAGGKMKLKEIILLVLVLTSLFLLADYFSFSLESTNNLLLSFFDPVFDFLVSIVSGILDFFRGFL